MSEADVVAAGNSHVLLFTPWCRAGMAHRAGRASQLRVWPLRPARQAEGTFLVAAVVAWQPLAQHSYLEARKVRQGILELAWYIACTDQNDSRCQKLKRSFESGHEGQGQCYETE